MRTTQKILGNLWLSSVLYWIIKFPLLFTSLNVSNTLLFIIAVLFIVFALHVQPHPVSQKNPFAFELKVRRISLHH